jgi:glucokinase
MILAGDFGGTSVKLGLVEHGVLRAQGRVGSADLTKAGDWLPVLKEHAAALCGSAGVRLSDLTGMAWALPMIIDPGLRRASWSFGKFDDAVDEGFHARAEALFGTTLLLENDARAAAIGEWRAGAGQGVGDLAMITLGTGIGTAIILEGRPLRGRSGMAGNLGGLSITHLGSQGTGSLAPGCIETRVATWALPAQAALRPGFAASPLAHSSPLDYQAVFAHAAAGDPLACVLRDEALEAWGALTLNLIQAFDPARVILGGGIMASGDVILPAVREFVNRHAVQAGGPVEIIAGTLGDRAALLGCEWLWIHETKSINSPGPHPASCS